MSEWIRIDHEKPQVGQAVYYWFGVFDQVYPGYFKEVAFDETAYPGIMMDCFHDEGGFLCDDVTYWMPRAAGDESAYPPPPSPEEKASCLYHPVGG